MRLSGVRAVPRLATGRDRSVKRVLVSSRLTIIVRGTHSSPCRPQLNQCHTGTALHGPPTGRGTDVRRADDHHAVGARRGVRGLNGHGHLLRAHRQVRNAGAAAEDERRRKCAVARGAGGGSRPESPWPGRTQRKGRWCDGPRRTTRCREDALAGNRGKIATTASNQPRAIPRW